MIRVLTLLSCVLTNYLSHSAIAQDVVGPIVGMVEPTSAHVLYRPGAAQTTLKLSVLTKGKVVRSVTASSQTANDLVAKFAVTGLTPATSYTYKIEDADGRTLVEPGPQNSFTTVDPARKGNRVTASFVSCVDIETTGIWKEMGKLKSDAVFLMGDTPYIDSSDLSVVRDRHRKFLQMPDLAALASNTPTVGTWDDHDFGRNNGNGRNMMRGKENTLRGFVDYRAHAQFGNGKEGVYHKVDLGMMEVFLLDPRYFSQTEPSPVDESQPTCFGADQWKWLLKSLSKSKAPFKVLAFGAIWQDKKNKETDDMFTYWYERDALLDFIKAEKISGVVLLGGDIHVARHLNHPQRVGYDLHDFIISPGHTRVITELDVYHPSLEWSLVEGWQFLTLTADGATDDPKLIAEFRQPGGVVNRKVELRLQTLMAERAQRFGNLNAGPSGGPKASAASATETPTSATLRAYWPFDENFKNDSALGTRIDAEADNGARVAKGAGVNGGALELDASKQQYVSVPRSFLDDNSASHTVSLWLKPRSLPKHGSTWRSFLLESTAEGNPSKSAAWHLSLGLRAAPVASKINLQLYTHTLKPASQPEAAPTAISQGPFDAMIDRDTLLNQWNHVAFKFDSKSLTLFLNGRKITEHKLPISGPASEFGGLILGGHREGTGRSFDGLIDEVRVWQGALDNSSLVEIHKNR